jgi:hypothetical protein
MSHANRHFNRLEYYPGYLPAEEDILEDTQHEEDPDDVADKIGGMGHKRRFDRKSL